MNPDRSEVFGAVGGWGDGLVSIMDASKPRCACRKLVNLSPDTERAS